MGCAEAEAVVAALRRLYAGDAHASHELEVFQASPCAQAVACQLLESAIAEVQFFAASTICRAATGRSFQPEEVDWLLKRACSCQHRPTSRQLASAAAAMATTGSQAQALAVRAVELLAIESCWQGAVFVLLALNPSPPVEDVCGRLGVWLGRGLDAELLECALRYPAGISTTPIGSAVEEAVRQGEVREAPLAERLPVEFRGRLAAAACVAADRGHEDSAASILQDLPGLGIHLLEPAAKLLRAPSTTVRLAAVPLWSALVSQLRSEPERLARIFDQSFAPVFFRAAACMPDEEVAPVRDALWDLVRQWQLATPRRLNLVLHAQAELEQALQAGGDWLRADAALWVLSRYAKEKRDDIAAAVEVCPTLLQQIAAASGLAPLIASTCEVIEAAPNPRALPALLDRRLVEPRLGRGGGEPRLAVAAAIRACCVAGGQALWAEGAAQPLAEELQSRALAGETGLVAAAAELLAVKDMVQPLAEQWANLCAHANPEEVAPRAEAFLSTIVSPAVCLALWAGCVGALRRVPLEARIKFVSQIVALAVEAPAVPAGEVAERKGKMLVCATQVWEAVWDLAEGDEAMIAAAGRLVDATARSSTVAAAALQALCSSFERAHSWSPQVVDVALSVVEASVAPAGSSWPLTRALTPGYGFVLAHAALLADRQPVSALRLAAAMASWSEDSEDGRALWSCLRSQDRAVRVLLARSEDRRLAERVSKALGLHDAFSG
mmetsp:Transcript_102994/g.188538  ORF Transcript_102994/g.188538 Transcript_102994/m.188538 type:complete len:726 (-) Transcript_102994:114-2291(-)